MSPALALFSAGHLSKWEGEMGEIKGSEPRTTRSLFAQLYAFLNPVLIRQRGVNLEEFNIQNSIDHDAKGRKVLVSLGVVDRVVLLPVHF